MSTRFKTLDEFYKAVNALIKRLEAEGFVQDAHKLDGILNQTAWTTGSELLGELSLTLRDMRGGHPAELEGEIKECLEFAVHHRKILMLG
jgi:hypothetical protein